MRSVYLAPGLRAAAQNSCRCWQPRPQHLAVGTVSASQGAPRMHLPPAVSSAQLQTLSRKTLPPAATSYTTAASRRRVHTVMAAAADSSETSLKILGISGSLRKNSANTGLLRCAAKQMPPGVTFEIANIDFPLFNEDLLANPPPEVIKFREQVEEADAIFFACPEYNYSMTGALKNALDWPSKNPNSWSGKPATVVGSGGGHGTGLAQSHLRVSAVFLNLLMLQQPEIKIKRFEKKVDDEHGDLIDPVWIERIGKQVQVLVDWTLQLRK